MRGLGGGCFCILVSSLRYFDATAEIIQKERTKDGMILKVEQM